MVAYCIGADSMASDCEQGYYIKSFHMALDTIKLDCIAVIKWYGIRCREIQ